MRRRINIDPESGDLEDITGHPYLYNEPSTTESGLVLCNALYDRAALWDAYQRSRGAARAIAHRLVRDLAADPLDAVEQRLAARAEVLIDSVGYSPEVDQIEEAAIAHAATIADPRPPREPEATHLTHDDGPAVCGGHDTPLCTTDVDETTCDACLLVVVQDGSIAAARLCALRESKP